MCIHFFGTPCIFAACFFAKLKIHLIDFKRNEAGCNVAQRQASGRSPGYNQCTLYAISHFYQDI